MLEITEGPYEKDVIIKRRFTISQLDLQIANLEKRLSELKADRVEVLAIKEK